VNLKARTEIIRTKRFHARRAAVTRCYAMTLMLRGQNKEHRNGLLCCHGNARK